MQRHFDRDIEEIKDLLLRMGAMVEDAINQSIPDSSLLKFESYTVTPSVQYQVNRVVTATLSYTQSVFNRTFLSQESNFDRNVVMLRIFAEWE